MEQAKIESILAPADDAQTNEREKRVRARFWQTLKRAAGVVPFVEELVAGYFCAVDPRTPARVRATLLAALAYFVLPFDLIPDFVVTLGFTDDVAVLTAALTAVQGHVKPRHRKAARKALEGGEVKH